MKRKIKRNKSNLIIQIIFYLVILSTISLAYSFLSEKLVIEGKVSFNNITSSEYEYEYSFESIWQTDNMYNYTIDSVIVYKGSDNVIGWTLNIWVPSNTTVIGCYNAMSCIINGNTLTITNASYNGFLNPNSNSVSIRTQIKTELSNYQVNLLSIEFIKEGSNIPSDSLETLDQFQVISNLVSDWGNKKYYTIDITNNSNVNLLAFQMTIIIPNDALIESIWGVEYVYKDETLIISGSKWDLGIGIGSTIKGHIMYDTKSLSSKLEIISFIGTLENGKQVEIVL